LLRVFAVVGADKLLEELKRRNNFMKQIKKESGFSLIETIMALVILLIGILSTMTAISFSVLSMQESEKRVLSKEIARSTMETIFSIRDLLAFDPQVGDVYNWNAIQVLSGSNGGIFLSGWNPVRENPGDDGIFGTADDACAAANACVVGTYTNSSAVIPGYERQIEVFDITENGVVRKRRITVSVRYFVGQLQRTEVESTIVANLPVN
jgi:prepilin-type N-terminal cleavage/methylation domain-containing protein